MLKIRRCSSLQEKQERFALFNPAQETWVVSDLQSKAHLQKELLNQRGVLEQNSVLRATELWKALSFQLFPEIRLISHELAQTLFWNWIEPLNLTWARSPQAVPVLLKQMKLWMSLFSDPRYEEIMAQWFKDNEQAYVRFGHWFELCATLWTRCQEQNLMMLDWLPAMLSSQDLQQLKWPKSLIFDLGPQISQVEGQLIKDLAGTHDIEMLFPEAPWLGLMKNTLRPYDILLDQTYMGDPDWQPSVDKAYTFGRFSTQLAEVKDTVARVRDWLEEGVSPQAIAVVAPDIEDYWPTLRLYFEQEGIPVAKGVSAKLGSFIDVAQWLSNLRTAQRRLSTSDLEMHFFARQEAPRLRFDEFRVLFSQVYDVRDIERARQLFEADDSLAPDVLMSVSDFMGWALRFWRGVGDSPRLGAFLQVLSQEVPLDLQLRPEEWLSYLEGIAARREVTLRAADEKGVTCVSLTSADWLPSTHGIFLNLCEESLRRLENSPVSPSQAQKIFADTGFAVGSADRQELEFELLWFLNRKWTNLHLCFAGTNFQGNVLTPSRLWMWAAFANDQLRREPQSPLSCRWDHIQSAGLEKMSELRALPDERRRQLSEALERDAGQGEVKPWGSAGVTKISASGLESYWACPFVFAAERKLKLSDDPVLDLDLDHRTRGRLLHALLEELITEPMRFEYSDTELESIIDKCREREGVQMGDRRLWPAIQAQHLRLARMFLDLERETRQRFPETRTVAKEQAFQCYWDIESGKPSNRETSIRMSGRMDRVDADQQNRYALIDYKASSAGNTNWGSWMRNHSIQLALYSMLIEQGLASLPAGMVVAANYYVVRDRDRRKGFHLQDHTSELYSCEDKHRNFITEEEKKNLFAEVASSINEAIKAIVAGEFKPSPENEKTCSDCTWRNLCRAPHLN